MSLKIVETLSKTELEYICKDYFYRKLQKCVGKDFTNIYVDFHINEDGVLEYVDLSVSLEE